METEAKSKSNEEIVHEYFQHVSDLRSGKEGAVEALMNLWDADGTFEFAGSPPVTGTFHGRNAIHVLYKNRFLANGMKFHLEPDKAGAARHDVALGVVSTDVGRVRARDHKIVAGWTTTMGTQDGRGFQVSGSHTFTLRDGKITNLKVVVSPRPDTAPNLKLDGLAVEDIGRLALAAWAVVA